MSDNKNIDRLFKEQFKDFEATPAAGTWDQIAAQLQHKKKRRVVPFWLKSSGIAAALVLGCFLLFDQNSTLELPHNKVATGKKRTVKTSQHFKAKQLFQQNQIVKLCRLHLHELPINLL